MGTIASVLQWTCTKCNLINPTECLKCLKCGNVRQIVEGTAKSSSSTVRSSGSSRDVADGLLRTTKNEDDDDGADGDASSGLRCITSNALNNNDKDQKRTSLHQDNDGRQNVFPAGNKASTIGESLAAIRAQRPKTIPGYVEISSTNG